MKVLIVCSGNNGPIAPFILEQKSDLEQKGMETELYIINGRKAFGYLKNLPALNKAIRRFHPDLIHAHYGFSGLLCGIQRKVPVILTLHGSDLNLKKNRGFSQAAILLSRHTIIVSRKMMRIAGFRKKTSLVPCGISLSKNKLIDKVEARNQLKLDASRAYILFSSSFDIPEKNHSLAVTAIKLLDFDVELIELKKKTREQVTLLLNAVDLALMTSNSEGSPQFIKEAMACNCPVVSTDVGDVNEMLGDLEDSYVCSFSPEDIAHAISQVFQSAKRPNTRKRILDLGLDSCSIANRIINVYSKTIQ